MTAIPRKLVAILTRRERWQLVGLLGVLLVTSLLQVAGAGSIMPVVALLANPDIVHTNANVNSVFNAFGFTSARTFLFFVGGIAVGIIILGNGFIALSIWLITRFAADVQARLSVALLDRYLSQPYSTFLERNSADAAKNVLNEVQQLTTGVLLSMLKLVAFGLIALFILGFLIWFNPLAASLAMAVLGGSYVLLSLFIRGALMRLGQARIAANTLRFKAVDEAFGGIKETKVLGRELAFVDRLVGPAMRFARAVAVQEVVGVVPRYAVEALAFGSVLAVAMYLTGTGAAFGEVIGVVAVYTFAGYRLLPAVQQIYQAWGAVRFNQVVLDTLHQDLTPIEVARRRVAGREISRRLPFEQVLRLDSVTFSYPNARSPAIQNVCLTIPRGSFVALVGETGAGKTTLADVILGLLRPQQGSLLVDDVAVHDGRGALRAWQNNLGYVPQEIFLTDDTVTANIAFGVRSEEVDHGAVERAARIANIHSFVTDELLSGYATMVGERGVRLSGGQRQRIGIARALYHNPQVLVLDEATSDLDGVTEAAVHQAIIQAAQTKTVVMIAHRLSTTRNCDAIYLLDRGGIVGQGTYAELVATDGRFRRLVRAGLGVQS